MYTIKRAAQLTGVPETSLRAWERRYGVFAPQRNEAGYRVYDRESLAVISTMRRLVDDGWSPAAAAQAVRSGTIPATLDRDPGHPPVSGPTQPNAATYTQRFLDAAAQMDIASIEESLDGGFALGSFEHVVDTWLFPTLEALGEGWSRGEIDIAGEHAASHAVHRRLSAAFDAAGSRSRGPAVVVGLPAGSQHELGALAFATAVRRRGLNVLYLGANVPVRSWETAVRSHEARAAVLAVVTPADRPAAVTVAEQLATHELSPAVCVGGAAGAGLSPGVRELAPNIATAAEELDELTHATRASRS
ncbi:MerR family transcriptional regulator [Nocardioides sp. LHG3406-4]|uniref:MerR family transcriptional regulator n=1 Tax=Nocardioides sp. LHG3406-4 TaxID=2804575 RepID=UPI003CEECA5D